jgi:flotillin
MTNIFASPAGITGIITAIGVIVFSFLVFIVSRIKKCPSDKILVIYGKVGNNNDGSSKSAMCIH